MDSRQRDRSDTKHPLWLLARAAHSVQPLQSKQKDASPGETP